MALLQLMSLNNTTTPLQRHYPFQLLQQKPPTFNNFLHQNCLPAKPRCCSSASSLSLMASPPPGYRRNIIFAVSRLDVRDAWQMPQDGINAGEDPQSAAVRELKEEIGVITSSVVEVLAEEEEHKEEKTKNVEEENHEKEKKNESVEEEEEVVIDEANQGSKKWKVKLRVTCPHCNPKLKRINHHDPNWFVYETNELITHYKKCHPIALKKKACSKCGNRFRLPELLKEHEMLCGSKKIFIQTF